MNQAVGRGAVCSSLLSIDQDLVGAIVKRAESLPYGITDPPEKSMDLRNWFPPNCPFALAHVLVGGYTAKYDLMALMQAVIEIGQEDAKRWKEKYELERTEMSKPTSELSPSGPPICSSESSLLGASC